MSQQFLGEIRLYPYNFAPRGWMFCQGQTLPISQYTALFSLLGTTYGGNGVTTFVLPDLRGRLAISSGAGPGLANYQLGQASGTELVTLIQSEMPQHNHLVYATNGDSTAKTPAGNFPGGTASPVYAATPNGTMNPQMVGVAGSGLPHENMQPYLVLNYCIAMSGIFPSRN
jgi:microcystin-dependent protein